MSDKNEKKTGKGTSSKQKIMKELGPYLNLGLQLAITVGLFALLGWWLDKEFDTAPTLVVICSLFGVAAGMYSFFRTIFQLEKKKKSGQEGKDK